MRPFPSNLRATFAIWPVIVVLALAGTSCEAPTSLEADAAAASVAFDRAAGGDFDLFFDDVPFRPAASADIHVRVFVNESGPCHDPRRTAFFIHGVNATAASWERLANAFFTGDSQEQLCLAAAIDHPGHGRSGLPDGVLFGELMIQDYARTVMEVLGRLRHEGIRPTILIGHSQGTSTTQALQQMLREAGTNVRERYGVRDVVFLGSQGPRELRASFLLPEQDVADLIASLVTTTPERGTFVQGPAPIFQQLWFINLSLQLSSAAPSLQTIAAEGWNADVPLFATLQAAGQGGFDTPSIDPGVFGPGSGSTLHFIDFADDPWSLTPRAREIYEYLTGDASLSGFVSLTDPENEAVHDYMISHPDVVRGAIDLPRTASQGAIDR